MCVKSCNLAPLQICSGFVSLSLLRHYHYLRLRNWGCEKLNYSPSHGPVYGEVDLKVWHEAWATNFSITPGCQHSANLHFCILLRRILSRSPFKRVLSFSDYLNGSTHKKNLWIALFITSIAREILCSTSRLGRMMLKDQSYWI